VPSAICGGALLRYLDEKAELPDEGAVRAKARLEDIKDLLPSNFAMPGVAALVPGFFQLMPIVQDDCALNITVMGIEDALDFGVVSCARAVPDAEVIRDLLADAFVELESALARA